MASTVRNNKLTRTQSAIGGILQQGVQLEKQGQHPQALKVYKDGLQCFPESAELYNNLGNVYRNLAELEQAKTAYQKAAELNPHLPEAVSNLGTVYQMQGQTDEALLCFEQALTINPKHIPSHLNRALTWLQLGKFDKAWLEYEYRRQDAGYQPRNLKKPEWDGTDLSGKTILLWSEQGFGDTIQFVRYLPLVKARGDEKTKVILEVQPGLGLLMEHLSGLDDSVQVIEKYYNDDPPIEYDVQESLLSLPRLFGTNIDNIPADAPYIQANETLVEKWRTRFEGPYLNIGVVWSGNPNHRSNHFRSCSIRHFNPLTRITYCRFHSLQKGHAAYKNQQDAQWPDLTDLDNELTSFSETAAVIANLDLVITVDTSVAHLAGAMGKPAWLLLGHVADWRWLLERSDSPWYPTMRIFRQPEPGDWASVFQQVADALKQTSKEELKNQSLHQVGRTVENSSIMRLKQFHEAFFAHQIGNVEIAEAKYRELLKVDPNHSIVLHLLGIIEHNRQNHAQARTLLEKAIKLNDRESTFFNSLGNIYYALQQLPQAEAAYEKAIILNPHYIEAQNGLGTVYIAMGQQDKAWGYVQKALSLSPEHPDILTNQGILLKHKGEPAQAETIFKRVLHLQPNNMQAWINLSRTLLDQNKLAEAERCYRRILKNKPNFSDAWMDLANLYVRQDKTSQAIQAYERALSFNPNLPDAYNNIGHLLQQSGYFKTALTMYDKAISLLPDYAEAHFNKANILLLEGNFEEGWREYEWRFLKKNRLRRQFIAPLWDGSDLKGKQIYVYSEQGFGDIIQFVRYLPLIKAKGGHVIFECRPELLKLLKEIDGADQIIETRPDRKAAADFDVQVPLLSLPRIFNTCLTNIPGEVPYIHPTPKSVKQWEKRLKTQDRKIGIVWSGNPEYNNNRNRSVSLKHYAALADIPGISWYSLQKGPAGQEAASPPKGLNLISFSPELPDFNETAAVISNLDLVITVDTAVAHLAGALGKPVWVLLSHVPDWRWLHSGSKSPWYPSMRLFRQPKPGNWQAVFKQVKGALQQWQV